MHLPRWPARDWRAMFALLASIIGAASLTFFAGGLVWIIWRGGWPASTDGARIDLLGRAMMLSLGGSLLVLVSLGLAINRREIRVGRDGVEISGGDGDPPPPAPAPTVTTTTEVRP